jgi:hypothetical protein
MSEVEIIDIDDLILDDAIQSRTKLDEACISEYCESLERGAKFPPVLVFCDGDKHYLVDGFHRVAAYNKCHKDGIQAQIEDKSHREAILFSAGCNATHGLRRTNEDKKKAVLKLLMDDEWMRWSDGVIAKQCAVSQPFVSGLRRATQNNFESPSKRIGADNRIRETKEIGKKSRSEPISPAEPESQDHVDGPQEKSGTEVTEVDVSNVGDNEPASEPNRSEDEADEEPTTETPSPSSSGVDQAEQEDPSCQSDGESRVDGSLSSLVRETSRLEDELKLKEARIQELESEVERLNDENQLLRERLSQYEKLESDPQELPA